jgi:UDP-N-acetylmuramyl pentapeptide phosphotransferase/UDP-N-acetylglucosamine-1-phosphate transferase
VGSIGSALKMKAADFYETLVSIYQSLRFIYLKTIRFTHLRENLILHLVTLLVFARYVCNWSESDFREVYRLWNLTTAFISLSHSFCRNRKAKVTA